MSVAVDKSDLSAEVFRTVLVQRYFPIYRKSLFEALAQKPNLDFLLLHGQQDGKGGVKNVKDDKLTKVWVEPVVYVGPRRLALYKMPHMLKCALEYDYDVIIMQNDLHCLTIWPTLRTVRKRGKKVIIFSIGFAQFPQLLRDKIRVWWANEVDAMILYSYTHKRRFVERGVPAEKIFVAPNAIDTDDIIMAESLMTEESLRQFRKKYGLAESNTIITAGRMVDYKRLDLLLQAAAVLVQNRPLLKLILIGNGPMLSEWKKMALQLGLENNVIWPGEIYDQRQLCYWFHSSDVCVAPAQQGLIANLCHSYGIPLITSDNPRWQGPEIQVFTNGKTGLLYKYEDVADLAASIELLLGDSQRRKLMGQAARQVVFEGFTIEKMCQGFIDAIRYAMKS